jgi:hypothetical protein
MLELAFRLEYYDTNLTQAYRWVVAQVAVNIFFLVTLVLDWLILGFKQSYSRHPRVFSETLAQAFFALFFYYGFSHKWQGMKESAGLNVVGPDSTQINAERQEVAFNLVKILEAIVIVRIIRLTIYLDEIKTFRIIMESVKCLLAPFWSILTVLYSIFFIYALTGMLLFGGMITADTEAIRNNDSTPANWGLVNFNDFPSSLVTLFSLMVVNNWFITVEMYTILWGSRSVLLFFVTFYAIAVLVGLNIIVCFAIDMYSAIRRLDLEQTAHEEKLYQLAL